MKGKKLLTISLIMTMVLAMIPGSAYAGKLSDSDSQPGIKNQIVERGGILYYDADGEATSASEDWAVSVSKTISAREGENQFTIDLVVETTQNISEVTISPDLAVVLVIDVSTSMQYPIGSTTGSTGSHFNSTNYDTYKNGTSRMAIAKTQARAFLDSYIIGADTSQRLVSLVTFGTTADVVKTWVDVNTEEGMAAMRLAVDNLTAGSNSYTFLQGGLQLASNLLGRTAIGSIVETNRFVVLLTDGNPTYRKTVLSSVDTSVNTNQISGASMANSSGISVENELNVPFCRAAAEDVANQIRLTTKIYTIATGTPQDRFSERLPNIGTPITASAWLAKCIAYNSSYHYIANDERELQLAFKNISRRMASWAEAWKVTDPMGVGIVFQGELEDSITSISDDNTLTWDLKEINPSYIDDSDKDRIVYSYKYSYNVELDTFVRTDEGVTNGNTVLCFAMWHQEDSSFIMDEPHDVEFLVPSVKGFTADLQFLKTGEGEALLDGAVFDLWYGDELYATFSSEYGVAALSGIPSGHTYTLVEATAPAGYLVDETPYEVIVSYGNITITPAPNTSDSAFYKNACHQLCFKNSPEIPVVTEGTLVISATATSTVDYYQETEIYERNVTQIRYISESYGSVTATNASYKSNLPVNPKNGNYLPNDGTNKSVIVPNSNHFTFATLQASDLAAGIELALVVGNKVDQVGSATVRQEGSELVISINGFYSGKFGAMAFSKMPVPSNGNIHSAKDKDLQTSWGGTAAKFDVNKTSSEVRIPMPTGNPDTVYLYIHGDFQFDLSDPNNPKWETSEYKPAGSTEAYHHSTTTSLDVFFVVYDSDGILVTSFTLNGKQATTGSKTLVLPAGNYLVEGFLGSIDGVNIYSETISITADETTRIDHIDHVVPTLKAYTDSKGTTLYRDKEVGTPKIVIKK